MIDSAVISQDQLLDAEGDPKTAIMTLMPPPPVGAIDYRIVDVREDYANDEFLVTYEALYPAGQLNMGF